MTDGIGTDKVGLFRKVAHELSMKSGVTEWLKRSLILSGYRFEEPW